MATATQEPPVRALVGNDDLLPIAPMIYVAWADGCLTDEEIEAIRSQAANQTWLDEDAQSKLDDWLDPENPPSANRLERLSSAIRECAGGLPRDRRDSLADLGVEIARLESSDDARDWVDDEVRAALESIEAALGVVGSDATRALLDDVRRRRETVLAEPDPTFDVDAMTARMEGRHHEAFNRVREVLGRDEFRFHYGLPKEEYREKVLEWTQVLADEGLGLLAYPEEAGGEGDLDGFVSTFEALGMFDLSLVVKFGVQFGLFGLSIRFLGTDKHHEKYLEDVGTLELPGGFAMTELGHGSNVRDIETTATFDPETQEFIIDTPTPSARKEWIGNAAAHGRMMSVFAQLQVGDENHGVHALLVPVRDEDGNALPGVTLEDCGHKMGLNGVDNGRIWFDDVRVPRENLLDRYGSVSEDGEYSSPIPSAGKRFFTMLGTLVGGRVSVGAAALQATKVALAVATRYSAMRRQFGPEGEPEAPILDYRTHKRRLMPRIATAYGLTFAMRYLVDRYMNRTEDDQREVEALAAGLKAYATWNAIDSIQEARESCGGMGFLSVNRIAQIRKDVDVFATFEGDNTVLMMLVTKSLLSEYKQQFEERKVFGVLKYIAKQASTAVQELNPIVTRDTSVEHLYSPEFQVNAMKYREQDLLGSVAQRLKRRLDEGMDSFEAFNQVQDHLMSLAHAHVERVVMEQFARGVEETEDEDMRAILAKMRNLYAMSNIHEDIGWFLENGYVEPQKARAIRDQVNELCEQLREQALPLVNAFGIPDKCLSAPVAFPDAGLPADSDAELAKSVGTAGE
ncbi:MAG: acyl-CoA dehydrogenase [Myxococcota bacterium]